MAEDAQNDVLIKGLAFKKWESNVDYWARIAREKKAAKEKAEADAQQQQQVPTPIQPERRPFEDQPAKDVVAAAAYPAPPPKKDGASNPVVPVVNAAGNAVVAAVTQLDQLFAANPPDP